MNSSQAIVTQARSWLGTAFLHQGRCKRTPEHAGGVDCLGLLIGVARELHLKAYCQKSRSEVYLADLDNTEYGHNPEHYALERQLERYVGKVVFNAAQPGDIALFKLEKSPQHLGILTDNDENLGLIHAYAPARKVVEHRLDAEWKQRIIGLYRITSF